jgi:hypothetical protein
MDCRNLNRNSYGSSRHRGAGTLTLASKDENGGRGHRACPASARTDGP